MRKKDLTYWVIIAAHATIFAGGAGFSQQIHVRFVFALIAGSIVIGALFYDIWKDFEATNPDPQKTDHNLLALAMAGGCIVIVPVGLLIIEGRLLRWLITNEGKLLGKILRREIDLNVYNDPVRE